jgi:hypothetical protein
MTDLADLIDPALLRAGHYYGYFPVGFGEDSDQHPGFQ